MKTETFTLDDIHVEQRLRPLNQAKVMELFNSIIDVGLMHPITVRVVDSMIIGGIEERSVPVLVAGHHRLEALRKVGEKMIVCNVIADGDLRAELAEIDENLIRSNLTPAEEASHMARRKEIYEEMHPEAALGGVGRGQKKVRQNGEPSKPDRFTKSTASATGRSERSVQRSSHVGSKLGPELLSKVVGTSLDKQSELDALVKATPEKRLELVTKAQAGETVTAKPLPAPKPPEPPPEPPRSLPEPPLDEGPILDRIKALIGSITPHGREQLLFWLKGNLSKAA